MKILMMVLFLWTLKLSKVGDEWTWTAYKVEDNRVVAILVSSDTFRTETWAKFNWKKYASFFNISDDQWNQIQ